MIEIITSRFDLVANIVICGLFLAVGYFVSTVIAEKRHFKSEEKHLQVELKAVHAAARSPEDLAEIERLRGEVSSQIESMKLKDLEIGKMIEQMNGLFAERQHLEARMTEALSEKDELVRLRSEMNAKIEEVSAKDREVANLREDPQVKDERVSQAEKIVADYEAFGKTIMDQRRSATDMEQRIQEMRIKWKGLSEKARENMEIIAAFAGAQEFEEFRRSMHLCEEKWNIETDEKASPEGH